MSRSPPLRFLVLLLAGWCGMRTALLGSGWWTPPAGADSGPQASGPAERRPTPAPRPVSPASPGPAAGPARVAAAPAVPRHRAAPVPAIRGPGWPRATSIDEPAWDVPPAAAGLGPGPVRPRPGKGAATPAVSGSRWSFAAWSFLREGDSAPLAAGGLLGGSQAGLRLAYRLNGDEARPLAVAARLASPLRRPAAAEAALGLDWQPFRRVPIHLLGERRQGLGREGRSAFALTIYGGLGDVSLGRLRVDAYAQAGIVGVRSRDRFGDGALRLSVPVGARTRLGVGAWAAVQPGLARFDMGPQASLRLPLAGRSVTVAADWRQRLAGNARPGSGPALTLATDF